MRKEERVGRALAIFGIDLDLLTVNSTSIVSVSGLVPPICAG